MGATCPVRKVEEPACLVSGGLNFVGLTRCTVMRVFSLIRGHLAVLDNALHGRLSEALTEIAEHGGDPELHAERPQSADEKWVLVVAGAGRLHRFEVDDIIGVGVVAHIHIIDYVAELRSDLARRHRDRALVDGMDFDGPVPRPRRSDGGSLS